MGLFDVLSGNNYKYNTYVRTPIFEVVSLTNESFEKEEEYNTYIILAVLGSTLKTVNLLFWDGKPPVTDIKNNLNVIPKSAGNTIVKWMTMYLVQTINADPSKEQILYQEIDTNRILNILDFSSKEKLVFDELKLKCLYPISAKYALYWITSLLTGILGENHELDKVDVLKIMDILKYSYGQFVEPLLSGHVDFK